MYAVVIAPAVLEVRGLPCEAKSLRVGDLEASATAVTAHGRCHLWQHLHNSEWRGHSAAR